MYNDFKGPEHLLGGMNLENEIDTCQTTVGCAFSPSRLVQKKKNFMTFHIGMRRFLRKMQDYQNFGEPKIITLTNQVLN